KKGSQARRKSLREVCAWQKEKRHKEAISPSAEGEEGSAPSTARAFEKSRPKLFVKRTKAGCFVYSL
ncbi:MAG: hypothetical protein IJW92_07050, partial [Clostridia bacterium]|nr:hypothetical protein [Clostridia bacterium]